MRKSKGFTLIELLVVIAIIGLLAAIIIVAISNVRIGARDGRIQTQMSTLRKVAALYYTGNNNSYSALSCAITSPDVSSLCADVNAQNGGTNPTIVIKSNNQAYCAYVVLATSGKSWCVDSNGASKKVDTTALPGTCAAATATCP